MCYTCYHITEIGIYCYVKKDACYRVKNASNSMLYCRFSVLSEQTSYNSNFTKLIPIKKIIELIYIA